MPAVRADFVGICLTQAKQSSFISLISRHSGKGLTMRRDHIQYLTRMTSFVIFLSMLLSIVPNSVQAQDSPFAKGWDIDPAASQINFGSVKFQDGKKVVETHSFATFAGAIEEDGSVAIRVNLDSVDTKNDLRNVRMRFLFFETFKYPEAMVTAQLTPDMAADLTVGGSKDISIPFSFQIHNATNQMTTEATVTVEGPDRISVQSKTPVIFSVDEFGLGDNLRKIAETAGGFEIVPKMIIEYRFTFNRRSDGGVSPLVVAADEPAAASALESQGDFSLDECLGRFEILSETGNIYFASGSANLDSDSTFVLKSIIDIVQRCPGLRILVSGHTDDVGSSDMNQDLSVRRAQAVVDYLVGSGIESGRLFATGFGEDRPMVENDSEFNRSRNRRIEFALYK